MDLKTYVDVCDELMELAFEVEESKRPSYTAGNTDVLHNFKRDAQSAGILPEQNWASHMLKQAHALARWAQDPTRRQSEPIELRFADLINYAKLGYALNKDMAGERMPF